MKSKRVLVVGLDFAPTVLKVMGFPIPKDMEGKAIKEVT